MLSEIFFIILILLVAFLIGFITAWFLYRRKKSDVNVNVKNESSNDHLSVKLMNDKLNHKDEQIAELEKELANVEFQLKDAKNGNLNLVANVDGDEDTNVSKVEELEAKLEEANLKLENANSIEMASNVNASKIAELEAELNEANLKLKNASVEVDGNIHIEKIKELEAKLSEANLKLENASSEVNGDTNVNKIAELEASLAAAQLKLKEYEALLQKGIKVDASKFEYKPLSAAQLAEFEAKAAADPNFPKEKLDIPVVKADYASDKDNLKLIKGVGPFIEFKMNALGIQNFQQVMNFTEDDIEKVTNAITFFPGRIKRDNWVDQAATFYKEKNSLK